MIGGVGLLTHGTVLITALSVQPSTRPWGGGGGDSGGGGGDLPYHRHEWSHVNVLIPHPHPRTPLCTRIYMYKKVRI